MIYKRAECAVFCKVAEEFGGYSNMAGGYPLIVGHAVARTSEALYQAMRFPKLAGVQQLIFAQKSPMAAKMVTKPYRAQTRPDWDAVRVSIMRWCLRVKLAQHWDRFGALLRESGDRPIVENSWKDDFWGAKPDGDERLVGQNVLGQLLGGLRDLAKGDPLKTVEPLTIDDFLILGTPIPTIEV